MLAVVQKDYGTPEALDLVEKARPDPGPHEVLVRVHAAALHAGDRWLLRGRPYSARLSAGWPKPRDYVPGFDLAGRVEAVGTSVSRLRPGDEVYGASARTCAEYACAREDQVMRKPADLTFVQAGAVPTSACTALQGLRDQGAIQPGQEVLINGASGGVGTFAVQIAKALGAEVTGVCSTQKADLVRSLGADHVIDYTVEDFTRGGPRYDLILDNVASHPPSEARGALKPTGKHIPSSGDQGLAWIASAMLASLFSRQQGRPFIAVPNLENLATLADLIDSGQVLPVIDSVHPLESFRTAFERLDEGHAAGKIVILLQQTQGTSEA